MKNIFAFVALLLITNVLHAQSSDSTYVKKGFSFGALPAIAYDDDLGFQYGVLSNLYWYGDGSHYPRYNHSLYLECSRYVAGTMLCRAYFDSHEFIPNFRTTADITWFNDLTCDFYGFNGRKSVYNQDFTDKNSDDYRTRVFYRHERKMGRLMLNLRRKYDDKSIFWQAGATAFDMKIGSVRLNKLRDNLPDVPTLYDKFVEWGILGDKEADGGIDTYLRGGFGIDTRDNEAFTTSGIWTEALIAIAPRFLSDDNNHWGKITIYHRQYFDLYNKNLVFAYRLAWQQLLWGDQPFYLLPHWNTSVLTAATSQGLGGSKTLRGVKRNRIVGDGSVMANAELRYIFSHFMFLGQQFTVGTNLFSDFGMVTQEHSIDTSRVPDDERPLYFSGDSESLHTSVGIGLKISLNANFIVSADWGKALSSNDGESGIYVMMNYLF